MTRCTSGYNEALRRGRRIASKEIGNSTDHGDLGGDNRTIHAAEKGRYSAIGRYAWLTGRSRSVTGAGWRSVRRYLLDGGEALRAGPGWQ
jgi:hypothetical protein